MTDSDDKMCDWNVKIDKDEKIRCDSEEGNDNFTRLVTRTKEIIVISRFEGEEIWL